jgi:putative oxidoreductase
MTHDTRTLPALARLLIASLFLISGLQKLAAPEMIQGYIAAVGLPLPFLAYLVALVVEIGGGLLLLAGLRTRPVAAALALFTIATALLFHRGVADPNQLVHFLKNLAIAGGLLQVAAFGAGGFSLDGLFARATGTGDRPALT